MADFKNLIAYISGIIDKFADVVPELEKQTLERVLRLTKELELRGNAVRISVQNLKLLSELKASLQKAILTPNYKTSVTEYVRAFDEVTKMQNSYFSTIEKKFKPPALQKEFLKLAKETVVNNLVHSAPESISEGIKDVLQRAITNGSSYENLTNQLKDHIAGDKEQPGQLQRYTRQIATDAINQYSRQYSKIVSDDLGLEWFRYAGSNLKTTRPFCLACTDRRYFHVSEIPKLLKGDFPEFEKFDGKIYNKTGLPQGMRPETDTYNFQVLLGGYNCGHQYRPVSENIVPGDIKQRVLNSLEYKAWRGTAKKESESSTKEELIKTPTAFSSVVQKKLQSFSDKDYFQKKHYKSGGVSVVHRRADKVKIRSNTESANMLAKYLGKTAEVTEHINRDYAKNPELKINGKIADNKEPTHSGKNAYLSISNPIKKNTESAIKQGATEVVIVIEKRYDLTAVIEGVRRAFYYKTEKGGKKIETVYLRYRLEGVTEITRKEYEDGTFVMKIESGFIPEKK